MVTLLLTFWSGGSQWVLCKTGFGCCLQAGLLWGRDTFPPLLPPCIHTNTDLFYICVTFQRFFTKIVGVIFFQIDTFDYTNTEMLCFDFAIPAMGGYILEYVYVHMAVSTCRTAVYIVIKLYINTFNLNKWCWNQNARKRFLLSMVPTSRAKVTRSEENWHVRVTFAKPLLSHQIDKHCLLTINYSGMYSDTQCCMNRDIRWTSFHSTVNFIRCLTNMFSG